MPSPPNPAEEAKVYLESFGCLLADAGALSEKIRFLAAANLPHCLQTVVDENSEWREKYEKRETACLENAALIAKLKRELEDERDSSKRRDSELSSLKKAKADAEKRLVEAERKLGLTKKELEKEQESSAQFAKLASPVVKLRKETILEALKDVFGSAYDLAKAFFNVDYEAAVVSTPRCWEKLRNHELIKRVMPLPVSNSVPAKQMRIAAALRVIASALVQSIFQPTYLLNEIDELSEVMYDLARNGHPKESHLRAVLMGIYPERQGDVRRRAVQTAVDQVIGCVGPLLSDKKRDELRSALGDVCTKAAEQWTRLQQLPEKIEPDFPKPDEDTEPEYWNFLSLPPEDDLHPIQQPNRASSAPSNGNRRGGSQQADSHLKLDRGDIVCVVWPSFWSIQDGVPTLLKEGLVIGEDQVKAAKNEENTAYRQARQKKRAQLMSANGAPGPRNGFLS